MAHNNDRNSRIRAIEGGVKDMETRIQRLGRRSEALEDALAESVKQNERLLAVITQLADKLDEAGADLNIDIDDHEIGPEVLSDEPTVDINFEDPTR